MTKLIEIRNNISQLPFLSNQDQMAEYEETFRRSELGKIYAAIPWSEIVRTISKLSRRRKKGPASMFDIRGKVALMFLKNYCNCSDQDLINRLNSDWKLQMFCGVLLRPKESITNFKVVSTIRCELAKILEAEGYQKIQEIFAKSWKPYMIHPHIAHMDATAYESNLRYPTDVKLLWECCEWMHKKLVWWYGTLGIPQPRMKFKEQKTKYLAYQKSRKKTYKMARKRKRSLLYLLNKLLHLHEAVLTNQGIAIHDLDPSYKKRYLAVHEVYLQQEHLFEGDDKFKNRIVSIHKSYVHPIVRGKENKPVEFGAKVHMVQIDGLNFIEHFSYEAFNECTRLTSAIFLVRKYTGKCTHVGADAIYATNKNRSYCSKENIHTSFVRKGKAGTSEDQRSQMQKLLAKDRSTRMEGSFGTEKNHYGLRRIMARTAQTEKLCVFFGVHIANLCRVIDKIPKNISLQQAA
ncbi:MAG: transposase [Saprospiraceae bacterium]|jgi:hypothetical protein|nr:transposase [Saprospiraceae bacterium]MBK6816280.1 transposase [Saprospiraceae bacterium]MBK7607212.1 transposase [Saprospiraceae bacterium]MBK8279919.1 transposase [Saprospiraceae bacterium]MBK9928782.1 transposase [Saprospiraceae bacterium]